jgi:hypothetical protein
MCCPSSLSVNTARFVTARAIDLKLCTYVPLGRITYLTKFLSDLILGLATRGAKTKNSKSALTPKQMIGSSFSSGIFSKDTWHRYTGFWFDLLLKVTEVKLHLTWSSSVSMARFVTTGAIDLKVWTYVPLCKSNSQTKFQSILILNLATRGPKPKTKKSATTPELIAGSSPNFYHRYI